jgi:hypothetical protein
MTQPKATPRSDLIDFVDRHGNKMKLSGKLTIKDLLAMGATDIRIVRPEIPMKENEWRDLGVPPVRTGQQQGRKKP